jgi:hypothetical protein
MMLIGSFFCSTTVTIGDGRNTPFWESRWLDGIAPKDLAPELFKWPDLRGIVHEQQLD